MRPILILSLALLGGGCAHAPQKPAMAAGATAGTQGNGLSRPAPGGNSTTCAGDAQCPGDQLCIRGQCVLITREVAECSSTRVHFDRDSSELKDEDRAQLERMARCLKADSAMRVTIEGNADERGTDEYNMALGDRRASTVERYLERLGVPERKLRAVSYGKEKPLCSEHDEACWSQNRRAALVGGR